jgi:hypothetical protein
MRVPEQNQAPKELRQNPAARMAVAVVVSGAKPRWQPGQSPLLAHTKSAVLALGIRR